jgi:agmatine deiminase
LRNSKFIANFGLHQVYPKYIRMLQRMLFLIVLVLSGCDDQPGSGGSQSDAIRQAAEFEPVEAVWMLWSLYDHKRGYSNERVTLDIIRALLPHTRVKLIFPTDSIREQKIGLLPVEALKSTRLEILVLPYMEFWARDMGPAFILRNNRLAMADFNFNDWNYGNLSDSSTVLNEKLDEAIASSLHIPVVSTSMITEGGNHEVNGKGTIILTASVERTRNPGMSQEQIESEFRRVLGVRKIIWLEKGLCEDDNTQTGPLTNRFGEKVYMPLTTNGHADEFIRFVGPRTILLAQADTTGGDPISMENHRRLDAAFRTLRQATDQDGQSFNIVRMPLPHHIFEYMQPGDAVYDIISEFSYDDGTIFPRGKPVRVIGAASYLNFLIANDCVIMPAYWNEGLPTAIRKRDEEARVVMQSVFPEKTIISLDVRAINLGGGGIHCITRNEPKSVRE